MRKFIAITIALALAACAGADTPKQKYFAIKQRYSELLSFMIDYKFKCYTTKERTHFCYTVVYQFNERKKSADAAFATADSAIKDGKIGAYDAALISTSAVVGALQSFATEKAK